MNFRSDNVAGIAPEILAAIAAANLGTAPSYGDDAVTRRLAAAVAALFEHEVAVFPVATGTAANALALATLTPVWGAIYCHEASHVQTDECGAPEFFAGGAKLLPLAGADAKLTPAAVEAALTERGVVHHVQPAAISISEATEAGTLYRPAEIAALGALARRHGLALHMDGARFANAVAALGCSPAELTWRAGVDVLSLGATKNGALAAEAVVFFDPAKAEGFAYRRKRGGHLFSKMRFLSAQLEAYLADGLWLRQAAHANRMAALLAAGLAALAGARLRHPVEANEVFVELPERAIAALGAAGFGFYRWGGAGSSCLRLVTAFDTRQADVEAFIATARDA
ncbi:MAG TPA: beta-eliminating lyase-related protein [Stellaceae bacterium]|nr:beta-eliminating lyase-related protein [Stellaceae bacterium]